MDVNKVPQDLVKRGKVSVSIPLLLYYLKFVLLTHCSDQYLNFLMLTNILSIFSSENAHNSGEFDDS